MVQDMRQRLAAARELVNQGKHDEATAEFEWLWENMVRIQPGMSGVRISFMARNIAELIGKHPPARRRFTEIRDRSAMLAESDLTTARLRHDWIVLNEILGEQERTLAWFDGVKDDGRYATVLDEVTSVLVRLLESHQRFREIGHLYKDPVATFVETYRNFRIPPECAADPDPDPDPDVRPTIESVTRQILRRVLDDLPKHVIAEAALMVTCLLAAGRTADADAVEREARRLDPSEAMRAALEKARGKLD
jgi:hypothetical protein